jgi:hypothetical protein
MGGLANRLLVRLCRQLSKVARLCRRFFKASGRCRSLACGLIALCGFFLVILMVSSSSLAKPVQRPAAGWIENKGSTNAMPKAKQQSATNPAANFLSLLIWFRSHG